MTGGEKGWGVGFNSRHIALTQIIIVERVARHVHQDDQAGGHERMTDETRLKGRPNKGEIRHVDPNQ